MNILEARLLSLDARVQELCARQRRDGQYGSGAAGSGGDTEITQKEISVEKSTSTAAASASGVKPLTANWKARIHKSETKCNRALGHCQNLNRLAIAAKPVVQQELDAFHDSFALMSFTQPPPALAAAMADGALMLKEHDETTQ